MSSTIRVCLGRDEEKNRFLDTKLWLIVDEFHASPAASAIKVVAYADDIALLVSGKFPSTLSEIMETALRDLVRWANGSGLEINPSKTELVLFTRRRRLD